MAGLDNIGAIHLFPTRSAGALTFYGKHCMDTGVTVWRPVREPIDPDDPASDPVLRLRGQANCCDGGVPGATKSLGQMDRTAVMKDGEPRDGLFGRTKTWCEICDLPCWQCVWDPGLGEYIVTDRRSATKKDLCVQTELDVTFGGFEDCCDQLNGYSTVVNACWYGPSGGPDNQDYCQIDRPWTGGVTTELARWTDTGEPTGTMPRADISDCPVIGTPEISFVGAGVRIVCYCVEDDGDPIGHRPYAYWDIYVRMRLPCALPGPAPVCCTFQSSPPPSGLRGCGGYAGCVLVPLEVMCGDVAGTITAMLECVSDTPPQLCTMELQISDGPTGAECP